LSEDDPRNWVLEIPDEPIALYEQLLDQPRPLTEAECRQVIDLIDAWRAHEHRKHIALMRCLSSGKEVDPSSGGRF
jgi:hypothetical protein